MVRSGVTSNHEDARRDLTCAARATRRRFMRTIRADGYTKGGGPIGDGSGALIKDKYGNLEKLNYDNP